ncbi:hypothetical protein J7L18_06750 [Candidatus Bathyarchaeota archaeon]|nr:hypothetical protein [Candidatus Bathyarchaeota archaeon]RLG96127.1 MAG: hypothetical protein DRO37_00115 [Candidatus Bathyarchaeota archaeon]
MRVESCIAEDFISMISKLISKLGLGEAVGKIFTSLLLHGGYLTQDELTRLTGYSTGLISSSLSFLEAIGLVTHKKKGRKKLYKAVRSILDVLERFFQEIVERQLSSTINYLRKNISCLSEEHRKNMEKLLLECEKARLLLELNIKCLRQMKALPLKDFAEKIRFQDIQDISI